MDNSKGVNSSFRAVWILNEQFALKEQIMWFLGVWLLANSIECTCWCLRQSFKFPGGFVLVQKLAWHLLSQGDCQVFG